MWMSIFQVISLVMALLQGHIHSDCWALQHGNSDWLVLARQTHALFATSVQSMHLENNLLNVFELYTDES